MQKEIQLTDKTLLVVGLPKEAYDIKVRQNSEQSDLWYTQDLAVPNVSSWIDLPLSHWQLLGIYPELTEEQAKMVVESHEIPFLEHTFCYPDYIVYGKTGFKAFDTAKESFQSLMEREKLFTSNPYDYQLQSTEENYSNHKCDKTELQIVQNLFNEAEKTTFDKYAILIKSK